MSQAQRDQVFGTLSENLQAQAALDEMLAACFALQKLYGRGAENSAIVTAMFHKILGEYQAQKVVDAFKIWLKTSPEFPTPSDIIKIIEGAGKPKLAKEVYVSISKKDPEHRTGSDWAYLNAYEAEFKRDCAGVGDENAETTAFLKQENQRLRLENHELSPYKIYDGQVKRLGEISKKLSKRED